MRNHVRPIRLLAGLAVLLAAACGGGSASDEPAAPEEFDPRIADLVEFVETERGLTFRHPVFVDFLAEEAYAARIVERNELTEEDREELERFSRVMRALGLVRSEFDALEAFERTLAGGTAAFYDIESQRILVRGTDLNASTRATVVHELTHALQDQRFDLAPIVSDEASEGEDAGLRALVEADAERIEDAFVATYDAAELAEYARLERELGALALPALEELPPIFLEFFVSAHVLGPPMLDALIAVDGEGAVDAAFQAPPTSEEHVIDVSAFLAGDLPVEVRPPALRDGEEELSREEFGMLSLLLMLGERLGFEDAWRAADGWGGAAFVSFERDTTVCVRIAVAGDTREDLDELNDAFTRWAATMPAAEAEHDGDLAIITSCDPGEGFDPPPSPDDQRTFAMLSLRAELVAILRDAAFADHAVTTCVVDSLVTDLGANQFAGFVMADKLPAADLVRLTNAMAAGADRCNVSRP